jgi:hypothetical protein
MHLTSVVYLVFVQHSIVPPMGLEGKRKKGEKKKTQAEDACSPGIPSDDSHPRTRSDPNPILPLSHWVGQGVRLIRPRVMQAREAMVSTVVAAITRHPPAAVLLCLSLLH